MELIGSGLQPYTLTQRPETAVIEMEERDRGTDGPDPGGRAALRMGSEIQAASLLPQDEACRWTVWTGSGVKNPHKYILTISRNRAVRKPIPGSRTSRRAGALGPRPSVTRWIAVDYFAITTLVMELSEPCFTCTKYMPDGSEAPRSSLPFQRTS